MMTRHYKVAGHTFTVSGKDEIFEQMGNYEPFRCEGGEPLFSLTEDSGVVPEYTEVYRQEEGWWGTIFYFTACSLGLSLSFQVDYLSIPFNHIWKPL